MCRARVPQHTTSNFLFGLWSLITALRLNSIARLPHNFAFELNPVMLTMSLLQNQEYATTPIVSAELKLTVLQFRHLSYTQPLFTMYERWSQRSPHHRQPHRP